MSNKLLNRVRMSVIGAAGTGALTLNTAATGFQTLVAAGMSDGDTTPYVIEDGAPVGSIWEIGVGTYHSNGTFSRDTVTQSSAGGSTLVTTTASAILNATFRAQDLEGAVTLSGLSDVVITSLSTNQSIKWNGDDWINYTTFVGPTTLAGLGDTTISSPADDDILTYNSGASKWENKPPQGLSGRSTPTVVQYGTISQSTTGAASITLGAAPTAGNILVFMGNGGDASTLGTLTPGIALASFDYANINNFASSPVAFECSWGYRVVRAGDSATVSIGTVGNSGSTMNGVLVEVAGADTSAISDVFAKRGQGAQGTSWTDGAVSLDGALQLLFIGGGNGTLTVSTPATCTYGPSTINTGVIAFNHAVAASNAFDMAATISSGIGAYDMMITIPGALE